MEYEVVCVDDGSADRTWYMLREQHERDPRWRCLSLARNFGHQAAVSAGMYHATGDAVVIIDADLQDPPEETARMIEKWREGFQVVFAVRASLADPPLKSLLAWAFYRRIARLVSFRIPLDARGLLPARPARRRRDERHARARQIPARPARLVGLSAGRAAVPAPRPRRRGAALHSTATSRPARTASRPSSARSRRTAARFDEIPMGGAGQVPDFTPFFQRAKDKKPDVFFVFVPAGNHAVGVMKTYTALGMKQAGIRLVGPGDITQDIKLQSMGDDAVGLVTVHHYNADLDNPVNKRLVAAWKKEYGADSTPDFMAIQGYDGMAAIAHGVRATKGKLDADNFTNALRGWKFDSPRGPIMIDPRTRDIIMNEYVSEIVKSGGRLTQKNIGIIPAVKDQCKELKVERCGS